MGSCGFQIRTEGGEELGRVQTIHFSMRGFRTSNKKIKSLTVLVGQNVVAAHTSYA